MKPTTPTNIRLIIGGILIGLAIALRPLDYENLFIGGVGAFIALDAWVKGNR